MGYGPVTFAEAQSVDDSAPGAPAFVSIEQPQGQNDTFACLVRLPELDADGSELTGLTKLAVATATRTDDLNPFEGKSMEEILALGPDAPSVVVELDPATNPPGSEVAVSLPVTQLGSNQQFAAACSD